MQEVTQKNILFIMLDQLRADALSCYGNSLVDTPNIDRLAAKGVQFNRCYIQGTSCGNSRASYYTGRHVRSHGASWNGWATRADELTMADHLLPCGLQTYLMGKTHMKPDLAGMARLGIEPQSELGRFISNAGFSNGEHDDGLHTIGSAGSYGGVEPAYFDYLRRQGYAAANPWAQWANAMTDEAGVLRNGMFLKHAHLPAGIDKAHSETAYTTDRAIDMIKQMDASSWCLHVSYIKPHWPLAAPEPYHQMYRGMDLPTPNKSDSEKHQAHPLYQAFMQQPHSKTYAQDDFRNHALPTYYGLVKEIDDNLGRLFASLEQQGQSERTMIVLTSDHGDYFGDHWLGEKDLFHDPVTRVPLIIMDPTSAADGSRGTQCDELTCAIDLVPTFVEWAGGEPQWQWLEGQSLLPVLHHSPSSQQTQPAVMSTSAARSYVVSECDYSAMGFAGALGRNSYNARMTMLFDGRYKYIHCLGFKPMLYDLQEDPQERVDLGRDKGYVDVRSQLTEQMMDWSAGLKNRVTGSESMVQQRMGKSDEKGILIGYWQQEDVPQALQLDPEVPLK